MALEDWDNNGNIDSDDDFIEYQIYKDVMEDKNDQYRKSHQNYKPYSNNARTTDGKNVSGEDLNGGVIVLELLMGVFTLLILYAAVKTEDDAMSFILCLFGVAVAVFGKWLLMGKRAIKKDAHEKYGIKNENEDKNKEEF